MAVQKEHDLPDTLVLDPRAADRLGAGRADALDLRETLRVLVDDLEGVGSERRHQPTGHHRAHAVDHRRFEKPLHRHRSPRRDGHGKASAELSAKARIPLPLPGESQDRVLLDARHRADHGHGKGRLVDVHARDHPPADHVAVDDASHRSLERLFGHGRMVACLAMVGASTPSDVRRYRAKLVEGHLTLVEEVARRVRSDLMLSPTSGMDEDLQGYGREALVRASRSYDSRRGVPFGRYARYRVRGAILDGVGEIGGVPRRLYRRLRFDRSASDILAGWTDEQVRELSTANEVKEALHTAYMLASDGVGGAWIEADLGVDGEAGADLLRKRLRESVLKLPDRERELLEGYYYKGESIDEIARRLGLSRGYANRLKHRALALLRRKMGLGPSRTC